MFDGRTDQAQLLLRRPALRHVVDRADEAGRGALGVLHCGGPGGHPPHLAVRADEPELHEEVAILRNRCRPSGEHALAIVGMDRVGPSAAQGGPRIHAGDLAPPVVHERAAAVGRVLEDADGRVVGERLEPG